VTVASGYAARVLTYYAERERTTADRAGEARWALIHGVFCAPMGRTTNRWGRFPGESERRSPPASRCRYDVYVAHTRNKDMGVPAQQG
jgi:hypothetical protein